jgi:hypothetical protein
MFLEEKAKLINILETICKKLYFPLKLLENLKKSSLGELADEMELYNKIISQANEYKNKLASMKKWGIVWNSYKSWSFSVNKLVINYNFHKNNVLKLSSQSKASGDLNIAIKNKILSQSSVNSKKIDMFMHVEKHDFEYKIDYFDEDKGFFIIDSIQYSNILKLLPICVIVEMGKSLFDCEHPIEYLDSIDIIIKESNL